MTTTILYFAGLIILSAFFSGIEIAFFSLSHTRVHTMVRHKLSGAKLVEKLKQRPQKLLVTILIGNNLVNIFAAALATQFALDVFGSAGVGIATGAVTLLVLVFGEIFPKAIAQTHAPTIARLAAQPVYVLQILLYPLVIIFEWMSRKVVGLFGSANKQTVSEEDVRSMMTLGLEEGTVEHHEKEFVERLFKFNDIPVRHSMTPIDDVVMLDAQAIIDQVSYFAVNSGYSRFPVYEGDKRSIIGIVHIKDIFKANTSEKRDQTIASITRDALEMKVEEKLDDAFRALIKNSSQYALIRDNTEDVIGVVTVEDLLEELVGEIYDESDQDKTSVIS